MIKKAAVIGMGAIGGIVAAYLKSKGVFVVCVGRPEQKRAVEKDGLIVEGVRGRAMYFADIRSRLEEKVDLAVMCVKTQDIRDAVERSREFLSGTLVLSTQNGVRADKLLSIMLGEENIVSSIVMFGATYVPHNRIVHNFEGNWLIGRPFGPNDDRVKEVAAFLQCAFEAAVVEDISAMKWTKLFVNFSNCLPALLGKSMQETYGDLQMSVLALALLKEGFDVVERLGIKLLSMPDFDVEKFKGLTRMPPEEGGKVFSGIMTNLSKEPLYGSILQSIQRGRPSEIDFINGEIANLAKLHNLDAKFNIRATELVHKVENTRRFLTVEEVLAEMDKAAVFPKDFV